MYIRLTLLFTLLSPLVWACDCSWKNIIESYQNASIVFYGKYIGKSSPGDVYDYSSQLIRFENFEVLRFYKGVQNKQLQVPHLISIKSTSNQACGFKFDSNHYYLVYAELYSPGSFFEVSKCSRTKKILNNQFIVPSQPDPEAGKDEQRELMRLAQTDTSNVSFKDWEESLALLKVQHEESQIALQKQLKKKNSMSIILSTTTLILLIYILLDFWKKKSKVN